MIHYSEINSFLAYVCTRKGNIQQELWAFVYRTSILITGCALIEIESCRPSQKASVSRRAFDRCPGRQTLRFWFEIHPQNSNWCSEWVVSGAALTHEEIKACASVHSMNSTVVWMNVVCKYKKTSRKWQTILLHCCQVFSHRVESSPLISTLLKDV